MAGCTDWSKRWKKLNESKEKAPISGFYFARNGLNLSKSSGVFMATSFSLHNHARVTWSRVKAVWHGWHLTRNGVRYGGDPDPLCASPFRIVAITLEIQKGKKLKKHRSENVQLILFLFCYILRNICLKERWGRGQGDINLHLIYEEPSWKTLSRSWKRFHSILMRRTSVTWAT